MLVEVERQKFYQQSLPVYWDIPAALLRTCNGANKVVKHSGTQRAVCLLSLTEQVSSGHGGLKIIRYNRRSHYGTSRDQLGNYVEYIRYLSASIAFC